MGSVPTIQSGVRTYHLNEGLRNVKDRCVTDQVRVHHGTSFVWGEDKRIPEGEKLRLVHKKEL